MIRCLSILFFCLNVSAAFTQSNEELKQRFSIDESLRISDSIIKISKSVTISNKSLSEFEKEKVRYYIKFLAHENSRGLKQAIYRQSCLLSFKDHPEMALLSVAISGFKQNYYNLPFLVAAKYQLTMNELIDERLAFKKSFDAAEKWMKHLSSNYDSPRETVLAFINTPGGLKRAKVRAESDNLEDFYAFLPAETRDDYFIYLALKELYKKSTIPEKNQIKGLYPTSNFKTITISRTLDLKIYESISGQDKSTILTFNPTLITDFVPSGFDLQYQNDQTLDIIDSVYFYQDSILNNPNFGKDTLSSPVKEKETILKEVYYRVKKGDNLFMISNWYDVEIEDIQIWNKLNAEEIYKGQVLKIWVDENRAFDLSKINFLSNEAKEELMEYTSYQEVLKTYKYYTVKKGDSLWLISQKYNGVSADDLMWLNGISANIEVGQQILIKVE